MRILITGGAGYIGTHTCVELLAAGHDIVVIDDFSNSSPRALERVRRLSGADFPCFRLNVRNRDALDRVFASYPVDAVIHFAGSKAVGESTRLPLKYYENNVGATVTLLKTMAAHGVKRLVFSSSATVYRADNAMPLTENAALGCANPYGWTKFMCERMIADVAAADSEFCGVLLRYFNPVGAHESGLIGEDPVGTPNNLMPFICQTAVGRREELCVFGNDYPTPDGTGVRDYIHVVDLAKGHVRAADFACAHTGAHPFNLGTGSGVSVLELVSAFERATGVPVPFRIAARRPGDIAVCYADPSRARRELHWTAEKDLASMCRDAWRWQSSNPDGYRF